MMTSSNELRNKKWASIPHNMGIVHKEEPSQGAKINMFLKVKTMLIFGLVFTDKHGKK